MERSYETLALTGRDRVATLTLRGAGAGNRIGPAMLRDLAEVCDALEDDPSWEAVVLTGRDGVFSRGIDLSEFQGRTPDIHGFHRWEKVIARLERLPMALVAAVDGPAVGGGFQLVLACDLRVATARSVFQLPEVRQGFLPGMATFRLAKYVGLGVAKRWVLTGEELRADDLLRHGVLDAVAPDGGLDAAVASLLDGVRPVHRGAWSLARRLLLESYSASLEAATGHLLAAQARAIALDPFLATVARSSGDG